MYKFILVVLMVVASLIFQTTIIFPVKACDNSNTYQGDGNKKKSGKNDTRKSGDFTIDSRDAHGTLFHSTDDSEAAPSQDEPSLRVQKTKNVEN